MAIKLNIIGETRLMKCGMKATCIAYRSTRDLDVQFEDGTIVYKRSKKAFYLGEIANPSIGGSAGTRKRNSSIINKEVVMKNGQKAKCIAYRKSTDIDIQFEDGTILEHKSKYNFLAGIIPNPNKSIYSCLNVTVLQNCGMKATCIRFVNTGDIDIQFEDGTILEHRRKSEFENGEIRNPNMPNSRLTNIVGEVRKMSNGQTAKCIRYKNANDIDIEFEDGTIVKNKSKDSFYKGWITNPNYFESSCLNETRTMNNGQKATCIRYNGSSDIDVKFEDGTILKNRYKQEFINGSIANPNYNPTSILGMKVLMGNGQEAVCIKDNGCSNIDIQFEDGTIVYGKRREAFLRGQVKNPNRYAGSFPELLVYESIKKYFKDVKRSYRPKWLINPETGKRLEIDIWIPSKKVGIEYDGSKWHEKESVRSESKARIIADKNEIDKLITILEKGSIEHNSSKHINYKLNFDSNNYDELMPELHECIIDILKLLDIVNPEIDFSEETLDEIRRRNFNEVLGQTILMECGLKAKCIVYRSYNDIDIEFEDGVIVQHKQKFAFLHGTIAHPSINTRTAKTSCLGEIRMMNCVMKAKCINYVNSDDIDVEFEDGTIIQHRQKGSFLLGTIVNPNFKRELKGSCLKEIRIMNNGQKAKCIEYRNTKDIDIEFEDGTVVKHKAKTSFYKGTIANPKYNPNSCLNMSVLQKCGYVAKCIAYRGTLDIDVEFDDGTIITNRTKRAFLNGGIEKESASCLGETRIMKCGMKATCIRWGGTLDIDVKFEDGTIVKNKYKANFYKGNISNPNIGKKDYAYETRKQLANCKGQTVMQKCGMKATCIEYRSATDIDVEFEDGTIIQHRQKTSFINGGIKNPNINNKMIASCIGEERIMSNGQKAKCIGYRNSNDIDIEFEDGTIIKNKPKASFYSGYIKNPNYKE